MFFIYSFEMIKNKSMIIISKKIMITTITLFLLLVVVLQQYNLSRSFFIFIITINAHLHSTEKKLRHLQWAKIKFSQEL